MFFENIYQYILMSTPHPSKNETWKTKKNESESKHRVNSVVCSPLQPPCCSPREEGIDCKRALLRHKICCAYILLFPAHCTPRNPFRLLTFSHFSNPVFISSPLPFQSQGYLGKGRKRDILLKVRFVVKYISPKTI